VRLSALALLLVSAVLIVVVSGCGGGDDSDGGRVLSGRVVDAGSLEPLPGISVVAAGREEITDDDGNWTMSNVGSGVSDVTITGTNYVNQTVSLSANGGSQDVGDTFLVPSPVNGAGNVSGFVTLAGNVVGGAVITAGGRTARSHSDAANKGLYTLYNVPAGIVTLNATYTDPVTSATSGASSNVTVATAQTTSVNIPLTQQPPLPPDID
jgi:hypothetical protein